MGYQVISPDDVEPMPDRPSEARSISEAASLRNLGIRTYHVRPGESIPVSGLHYHDEQEEVFFVLAGELSVETPAWEYTVPEGSFFVAERGSPHRAFNAADAAADLDVLAVGAPAVSDAHTYEG
jgi:uncharacterized cupin superfamily protein